MATLNPTLSGGIGFERAVEQPSALSVVASLADLAVSATKPVKPEKPTESQLKEQALQPFAQRIAQLRNSDLTDAQFTKEVRRIQREQLVATPQYGPDIRNIVGDYGVQTEVLETPVEDALTKTINDYANTAEGQSDLLRSITFNDDGSLNEEATQTSFRQYAAESLAEQAAVDRSARELAIVENDVKLWKAKSEQSIQTFTPKWTTKSQGIVDSLVMSAMTGNVDVDTSEEQFAYLRNARRVLEDEYVAKSQAAGIHPEVYRKNVTEALAPLDNLLNTMNALAGDNETILKAFRNAKDYEADKALYDALGPMSRNPEFMRNVMDNLGSTFYNQEEFKKALLGFQRIAQEGDPSGLQLLPTLPADPRQATTTEIVDPATVTTKRNMEKDNPGYLDGEITTSVNYIKGFTNLSDPKVKQEIFKSIGHIVVASEAADAPLSEQYLSMIFSAESTRKYADIASGSDTVGVDTKSAMSYFIAKQVSRNMAVLDKNIARIPGFTVVHGKDRSYLTRSGEDISGLPYSNLTTNIENAEKSLKNINILRSAASRIGVAEFLPVTPAEQLPQEVRPQSGMDTFEEFFGTEAGGSGAGGGGGGGGGSIGDSLGIDFEGIEQEYGLPVGYLERTAMIESSGNPSAKNPSSSAGGLFQQIDSNAKQYGVRNRFNPLQSTIGAAKFARDNFRTLKRALGRDPNAAELYLAHQQGGAGAARLLTNQTAKAVDIVGERAVTLNGGTPDMTAGQFANIWISKFTGGRTRPTTRTEAIGSQEVPPVVSMRPRARGEIDTDIPQRATESLVQGDVDLQATEVAQDEGMPAAEAPRASPEAVERARKVWSTLSEETKTTLARILGTEEEAIRMLAERELSEEDVMNVN